METVGPFLVELMQEDEALAAQLQKVSATLNVFHSVKLITMSKV